MDSITVKAYAKINLGLDVIRKREDGYHEVCMIMQSLALHDTLKIRKTSGNGIFLQTNRRGLPVDMNNLVYKAAALFLETISAREYVHIMLDKKIPIAAGLAGGSSDAAATLKGLNELYDTGMTQAELMKLGVKLGADVPYCILLGTALSEGIGEILTPLPALRGCQILLVKPDISVSTRYVYENLRLNGNVSHPDIAGMRAALAKDDLVSLAGLMDNILQTVTIKDYPVIHEIKSRMTELGAMVSLMSGSGPTVFGIYRNPVSARKAFHYFRVNPGLYRQVFLTYPYQPTE
jgi:4-diphosphocytidyl-2-C-methyl-D-erythritol kinase